MNLRSRRGEGYIALTMLLLPLLIIVMSLAIDGLGLAASYRRAVGLATVGAQAGAASVSFGGGSIAPGGDACGVAVRVVCENAGDCRGDAVGVTCVTADGGVMVTVALKPIRMFGGPLALGADRVVAVARGAPAYGINYGE